jgi:23S rRNA-/tRNA-specific pseudouridylate synthase
MSDLKSEPLNSLEIASEIASPDEAETIELAVEGLGGRLDAVLAEQIEYLSRSRLQKLIAGGHVTVNDQLCDNKKTLVKAPDWISIVIPPAEPMTLPAEDIPLEVLYEDSSLIIINKAAGMVVHPSPGHSNGTLVNALLFHCGARGETLPGITGIAPSSSPIQNQNRPPILPRNCLRRTSSRFWHR